MAHFVLHCTDHENAVKLRPVHREAHLSHVRGSGMVRVAGPLVGEGDAVVGSLLVIEADNRAAADAFSQADPYRQAGVYSSVEILPFRMTYVSIPGAAD